MGDINAQGPVKGIPQATQKRDSRKLEGVVWKCKPHREIREGSLHQEKSAPGLGGDSKQSKLWVQANSCY